MWRPLRPCRGAHHDRSRRGGMRGRRPCLLRALCCGPGHSGLPDRLGRGLGWWGGRLCRSHAAAPPPAFAWAGRALACAVSTSACARAPSDSPSTPRHVFGVSVRADALPLACALLAGPRGGRRRLQGLCADVASCSAGVPRACRGRVAHARVVVCCGFCVLPLGFGLGLRLAELLPVHGRVCAFYGAGSSSNDVGCTRSR